MGASEWGKPPNALRAKGIEKEEEEEVWEGRKEVQRFARMSQHLTSEFWVNIPLFPQPPHSLDMEWSCPK
jgi:hypothetical protein